MIACTSCRRVYCSTNSCRRMLGINSLGKFLQLKQRIDTGEVRFTCLHCRDPKQCMGPKCFTRWTARVIKQCMIKHAEHMAMGGTQNSVKKTSNKTGRHARRARVHPYARGRVVKGVYYAPTIMSARPRKGRNRSPQIPSTYTAAVTGIPLAPTNTKSSSTGKQKNSTVPTVSHASLLMSATPVHAAVAIKPGTQISPQLLKNLAKISPHVVQVAQI